MGDEPDGVAEFARLRAELARAQAEIDRLRSELAARLGASGAEPSVDVDGTFLISEVDVRRAVARQLQNGARLLTAAKCVYLLFDGEDELIAQRPALGLEEDQLNTYRVPVNRGFSGEVFRTQKPVRSEDLTADPRGIEERLDRIGASNGLCVPLVFHIRDEENRVIDSRAIGVLWVMNRRRPGSFTDDDERLLIMLARQVAAVVSNAKAIEDMFAQNRALVSTFENLPAGILFVGSDERIRLINGPARQLFGLGEMKVVGEPYYRVVGHQATCEILGASLRENADKLTEAPFEYDDEEHVFQIQAARVRDEDDALDGVVAIFNDVTEIHRVDSMKQEFVQTFSTELLGPLASIQGFASMLATADAEFESPFRTQVQKIVTNECRRLRRHIQDLLNVSRFEQGIRLHLNNGRIDVPALTQRVVQTESSRWPGRVARVEVAPDVPNIRGDEARVDEILTNLLSNAFKYSPDGGEVIVKVSPCKRGVRFEVRDHGVGIAPENREAVFRKFARVAHEDERVRAGRGIGLFISRVFVEAHGGEIGVESTPGEGSTFWFELPLVPPRETEEEREG